MSEHEQSVDSPTIKPEKVESSEDHLTLKVTDNNTEVLFRVRKTTPLKRVIDGFCKRTGKDRQSLRFLADGDRVNDDDTPEKLGLEDNDVIEVLNQQVGGSF